MQKFERGFHRFYRWILIVMFIAMVISTIMQVIFRYFLRYPLGWTEELSRILFIWTTFLSVGLLAKENRLLKVDALVNSLSPRAKEWVYLAVRLLSAGFIFWLGFLGIRLLGLARGQLSPALGIPYWYIYLSLPVGMGFAVIYLFSQTALTLRALIRPRPQMKEEGKR